ncbi:hypothetical protein DKX38_000302 [Salix brachista]|uniref:Adenylate kinase n=1 Tax=Salix brachista TaxID=2182728 RepID=A0A5N5P1X0_9ROSI|nr:hypothetical protein DKX38_000302 [Salix brachista]
MEPGVEIEEQPESPLLIAMKGHSSSSKSKIVHALAQFHKLPVFDEGDIISALQDSLETEHCDDLLPLDILSQISSTQLCLKLGVFISAHPSRRAHFDRLVEPASFTGSRLVVVECRNQNDHDLDYYDVGNVPRLDIDTTKPFHAEDFTTGMLKAAALI